MSANEANIRLKREKKKLNRRTSKILQVTKSTASEFTGELSYTKSTESDHLDQMRPRLSCTEENGAWRRKRIAHDPKHTTSFVKQGERSVTSVYWWCYCWWKEPDQFWSVQGYTLIQPNPAKLITQRFLVQMDDIPKHTAEATQVCQGKNIYIIRVNHLISGHYCML